MTTFHRNPNPISIRANTRNYSCSITATYAINKKKFNYITEKTNCSISQIMRNVQHPTRAVMGFN